MEDRIDIVTVDRVDPTSAQKIRAIGAAAGEADRSLAGLNRTITELGRSTSLSGLTTLISGLATSLPKLSQAQAAAATLADKTATAYLKQEAALNAAVVAEERAQQAILRTSQARSADAAAMAKVNIVLLEQERAVYRSLAAEQDLAAATARAELAQFKLSQAKVQAGIVSSQLSIQYLKEEEALSKAIMAEARAAEVMERRASASKVAASSMQTGVTALNEYAQAAITATTATVNLRTVQEQLGQRLAYPQAGMGVKATTSVTPTGLYNTPYAPASPLPVSPGAFALPGGAQAYSVTVKAVTDLDRAQQALGVTAGQTKTALGGVSAATEHLGQASQNAAKSTAAFGRNGRLAAHEMANLGFQLQDIVVSLAGGQNPFMVLLQQGAQIQGIYSMRGEGVGRVFSDIGGILLRLVSPATVVAAGLGAAAFAIGDFSSHAGDIDRMSKLLQLSAEQVQILQKSLNQMSRGNMSFSEFAKEAKDFALALDNAARNPKSQLNRLFEVNNKSITDGNGKLKDQNVLWRDAVGLIQGARNEIQAIKIGEILGLQEDFTREIYKSKQAFTDVQSEVKATGMILDDQTVKKAAAFEKAWQDAWTNFKKWGGDAITSVEAQLVSFISGAVGEISKLVQEATKLNPQQSALTPLTPGEKSQFLTPEQARQQGATTPNVTSIDPANPAALTNVLNDWMRENGVGQVANDVVGDLIEAQRERERDRFRTATQQAAIASRPDAPVNQSAPSSGGPARQGPTVIPPDAPPKEDKTEEKRADALAKINRELDAQLKLMGMLGPERQIQQQMSEIENTLANKKITLDKTEKDGILDKLKAIQEMQPVQEAMNRLYEEAQGPLRDYNALIEAGSKLLAEGKISAKQYADASLEAWEKVLENQDTVGSGIELGFSEVYGGLEVGARATADYVKQAFSGVEDAFVQLASTGKISFESLTTSILADITRMIFRLYILKPLMESLGLGTATPTPAPSPGLGAPGTGGSMAAAYDNGADFTVGGSTGKDRNMVMFRATRGERVQVTRADHNAVAQAGRASTMGGGGDVQVNFINQGAPVQARKQERRGADGKRIVDLIVQQARDAVAQDIASGGNPIAKNIETRFNLNSAAGLQI